MIMAQRYCILGEKTKKKVIKVSLFKLGGHSMQLSSSLYIVDYEEWAAVEAAVIRQTAVHGLLLARRSEGARLLDST